MKKMRIDTAFNKLRDLSKSFDKMVKDAANKVEEWKSKNILDVYDRDDGIREIRLFGDIGLEELFNATPQELFDALDDAGDEVNIVISSPGGILFAGREMVSAINRYRSRGGRVVIDVVGFGAGSAATFLLAAADHVRIEADSRIMIHRAMVPVFGNSNEMREAIEVLNRLDEELITLYADWTGNSRDRIEAWIDEETSFNAEEALEYGFADEIVSTVTNKVEDKEKDAMNKVEEKIEEEKVDEEKVEEVDEESKVDEEVKDEEETVEDDHVDVMEELFRQVEAEREFVESLPS